MYYHTAGGSSAVKRLSFGGLFCFGVKFIMNFFEVRVGDVGVNLGGGDIGMTEHSLDGAEVSTVHE